MIARKFNRDKENKGQIVREFAKLIDEMWSNSKSIVDPTLFKRML